MCNIITMLVVITDLKPKNVLRMIDGSFRLIDLDASARIGIDPACDKYSSAYVSPELIARSAKGVYFVKSETWRDEAEPTIPSSFTSLSDGFEYEPVVAAASLDGWALGVLFYELFSGKSLFHADYRDNITDQKSLQDLHDFTPEFKNEKLAKIKDPLGNLQHVLAATNSSTYFALCLSTFSKSLSMLPFMRICDVM